MDSWPVQGVEEHLDLVLLPHIVLVGKCETIGTRMTELKCGAEAALEISVDTYMGSERQDSKPAVGEGPEYGRRLALRTVKCRNQLDVGVLLAEYGLYLLMQETQPRLMDSHDNEHFSPDGRGQFVQLNGLPTGIPSRSHQN